jgi:hypothetical protein
MKWISDRLFAETEESTAAAQELDRIEEQLWSAHKLIKRIAGTTWDDEHRIACQQWIDRYPEPQEDPSGDR